MTEPNVTTVEAARSQSVPTSCAMAKSRAEVIEALLGSAARDEMTAESDVDVFIDYESDGSFTFVEWARLEELLKDCLGRKVDVLTRRSIHPRLKDRIERSSIRIL